jgi:EF-P beta-lysylation protein EpmB
VRNAVRDPRELAMLLELPADAFAAADAGFALLVPRGFVARMRKGDLHDPLLRQIAPTAAENLPVQGFSDDPLAEHERAEHGLLRKYARRALLIASAACPVHCRYCFRRAFPYSEQQAARGDWDQAVAALGAGAGVDEVILSGGDPLTLGNGRLARLIAKLEATGARTLRIHTRFPIVVPERVDAKLLELLAGTRLRTVVVVHCNHPNEIDAAVAAALRGLRSATGFLLNQSVLLAGVNDDADTLVALSERLFECGALPYYLHLLDRVSGTAHFEVDEKLGKELIARVRARLPGYLVPRLVRESPGELSKTPVV